MGSDKMDINIKLGHPPMRFRGRNQSSVHTKSLGIGSKISKKFQWRSVRVRSFPIIKDGEPICNICHFKLLKCPIKNPL